MAAAPSWADLTEEAMSDNEPEEMLRWAHIMNQGTNEESKTSCQAARQTTTKSQPNRNKKPKWVKKKPLPTQGASTGTCRALDGKAASAEAPHPTTPAAGNDGELILQPLGIGLQSNALQSLGNVTGPLQFSGWLLDLEIQSFICAVMQPDSYLRWGRLSAWQRDLQQRSSGWDLPCPFWHAVLYDLDLQLHVEVEAFARVLLTGNWSLTFITPWQRRLRFLTRRLWFPERLWYDLIHRINLRGDEKRARMSLANLMSKHGHEYGQELPQTEFHRPNQVQQ